MLESSRRDFLKLLGIGAAVAVLPMPPAIEQIVEASVLPEPDQRAYAGMIFERNGVATRLGHLYQMTVRPPALTQYHVLGEMSPRYMRSARHQREPIELELSALRDEATAAIQIISSYHDTNFGSLSTDLRGMLYSELKLVSPNGNKAIRFCIGEALFRDVDIEPLPPQRPGEKLADYRGTPYRFDANDKPLDTSKLSISVYHENLDWVEV